MKRVVLLAALLVPRIGDACGDGGGDSGGGGGDGGGDGGGGGGGTPSCQETSGVVGREECTRFGAWSVIARLPALAVELGMVTHHFLSAPVDEGGTVTHLGMPYAFRVVSSPGTAALATTALAMRMRVAVAIGASPLYAAVEADLGGLVTGPALHTEADTAAGVAPELGDPTALYVATHAVVGLRATFGTTLSLGTELAGGMRAVTYTTKSQLGECVQSPAVTQTAGEVEARVRADYWLTPRLSLGATLGTSLVDRGDRSIAVVLSGHLRALR